MPTWNGHREGGPAADAGLTGRKIIVDSYGAARHGGGAFSGKDGTKVDRSGAYAARQLAKDVVARSWARASEVQIAYAIGEPAPISICLVGPGIQHHDITRRYADLGIDLAAMLRPRAILDRLSLREGQATAILLGAYRASIIGSAQGDFLEFIESV